MVDFEEETDELIYVAELTGEVNGQSILVNGEGVIRSNEGLTQGQYELESLPDGFSPLYLATVLITGYPNACASLDGSMNLFRGTSYHYEREVAFRDGGALSLKTRCELDGRTLRSEFALTGTVEPARVFNIEPLVESWEATGRREIEGSFKIAWKGEGGSLLSAEARSRYHVRRDTLGLPLMHRFIAIEAGLDGNRLFLTQNSFTFRRLSNR